MQKLQTSAARVCLFVDLLIVANRRLYDVYVETTKKLVNEQCRILLNYAYRASWYLFVFLKGEKFIFIRMPMFVDLDVSQNAITLPVFACFIGSSVRCILGHDSCNAVIGPI